MTDHGLLGVIVAAGSSQRMGRPKQLLSIGGVPMLAVVVAAAEASTLDRVVVVTGAEYQALRNEVVVARAEWVNNPDPGRGSISSFRAGLTAGGPCDAAMLLAGDQPEVSTDIIDAAAATWRADRPWALRARYREGVEAQPFVFSAEALSALSVEHGDKVLWRLMEAHRNRVETVEIDAELPVDVNAWPDYVAVCARLGVAAIDG